MIAIPVDQLAPELLEAVIESFVLREGTDYGDGDFTLEQKQDRLGPDLQHVWANLQQKILRRQ